MLTFLHHSLPPSRLRLSVDQRMTSSTAYLASLHLSSLHCPSMSCAPIQGLRYYSFVAEVLCSSPQNRFSPFPPRLPGTYLSSVLPLLLPCVPLLPRHFPSRQPPSRLHYSDISIHPSSLPPPLSSPSLYPTQSAFVAATSLCTCLLLYLPSYSSLQVPLLSSSPHYRPHSLSCWGLASSSK